MSVLALVATACSSDDGDGETAPETVTSIVEVEVPGETITETSIVEVEVPVTGETITFWSTETQPARMEATQGIIERFTAATGITVILQGTDEDALPSMITANAAAGTLPDVVFHGLEKTIGWAAQGILDVDAANAVVESLGADTFAQGARDLVTVDGKVAAVPSDGWGQLLIYRKDLFDAAGLAAPTTFDLIEAAAAELHDPGNNFVGITMANDAGQNFTQQTFEHFALANGCQLVDDAGNVTLNSSNCVGAIDFFTRMLTDYSVEGVQDVVTTRATYFAGQAGMIVWSPFIMDEMAGLRDAATPSCPECDADIAYLARNSGFVPSFSGPDGSPAQYGQVSYMGITTNANVPAAQAFLEFWYNEGYVDWLAVSPEGKFPMRQGPTAGSTDFIEAWKGLETGVDRQAKLTDFYGPEIIDLIAEGSTNFDRWAFPQGQGELMTAVTQSLPVPAVIRDVLDGLYTPEEAAEEMQLAVEEEQELLTE
jgi:multiple sugar transport system substrate-binding protein